MTDSTEASFFHSVCLVQVWPTVYFEVRKSLLVNGNLSKIDPFNTYDVFLGLGVELYVPNLEGFFSGGVSVPVFTEFS